MASERALLVSVAERHRQHDVISHAGAAQLRENGKFWLLGGGRQTASKRIAVIRASDRAVGQNGVLAQIPRGSAVR